MASLPGRLKLLARGGTPQGVAGILAGALPHAEPEECPAICTALAATGQPRAVAAVIEVQHALGPQARQLLGDAQVELVGQAIRLIISGRGSRRALLNALALAQQRGDVHLLEPVLELLDSPLAGVAGRAAAAMLAVVVKHTGPDGRRRLSPEAAGTIDTAVAHAVSRYHRHRQGDVLLAAAILAVRPGPSLAAILSDSEHPVMYALRRVVARPDGPASSRLIHSNLLAWLTVDALGKQAARWMEPISGPQQFEDVLRSGHLLLAPRRRQAIRRMARPVRCLPDLSTAAALSYPAQVHLVRLIAAVRMPESVRIRRLADLIALPHPTARLQAVIALLSHDCDEADRAIDLFCSDPAEPVAYLAAQQVFARPDGPGEGMLRRLGHSAHPRIARRATAAAARLGVEAFFERWLTLSSNDRLAAALTLTATQRSAMCDGLAGILRAGQRAEKLAAITLTRRLSLVAELEAELVVQVADADSHVASAALAALPDGGSTRRLDAIHLALRHGHPRVRANALEALMHIDRQATDHFGAMATSRDNRTRANAVWALLRCQPRQGIDRLRRMLADADPLHRVSGVWVAQRARATPVVDQLSRLAQDDRLPEVRTRASAAARLLRHQHAQVQGSM